MAYYNAYGGVGGGFSSEPVGGPLSANNFAGGYGSAPAGVSLTGIPVPTAGAANAANLAFTRGAIASDPTYKIAQGLLNPNDPLAMRDVARKGAEAAVATGTVGGGVSGQYTGRLRQYDIERRAQLGNQLLSGAYGRAPAPVNPYAEAQLRLEQANAENSRLLQQIQSRYTPGGGVNFGGGYGGGGGGRSAPLIIGGGGGGGYAPQDGLSSVRPLSVTGGYTPPGGNQVAYGYGGPGWNAANQASQGLANQDEYAPGTMYMGPNPNAPISDEDFYANFGV